MGYSVDILNNIRANASQEYQNRIPEATRENIANIGNALSVYSILKNEFCEALINKIGKTIIESKLFQNRLARFKSGTVMSGQDVEEIFIEMAKAEGAFDPEGKNPLGRRENPDVKAIYHRMNRRDKYVITIGDMDFTRVFRSEGTLETFVRGLINSVYSGANYDEWVAMKKMIADADANAELFSVICPGAIHFADSGIDEDTYPQLVGKWLVGDSTKMSVGNIAEIDICGAFDNQASARACVAREFLSRMRKVVMDMSFPSTQFNSAGVMTWTNPEDMVLLVNKDLMTDIDVDVLSKTFHIGKTDVQVEVIPMDDFSDNPNTVYGVLVDKDWFRIYDIMSKMEPQRNADGLFTNYFYHVWQILSTCKFKNAVIFRTE